LYLNIINQSGKKILRRRLSESEKDEFSIQVERNNLSEGAYFYSISGENYYCAGKFMIIN